MKLEFISVQSIQAEMSYYMERGAMNPYMTENFTHHNGLFAVSLGCQSSLLVQVIPSVLELLAGFIFVNTYQNHWKFIRGWCCKVVWRNEAMAKKEKANPFFFPSPFSQFIQLPTFQRFKVLLKGDPLLQGMTVMFRSHRSKHQTPSWEIPLCPEAIFTIN